MSVGSRNTQNFKKLKVLKSSGEGFLFMFSSVFTAGWKNSHITQTTLMLQGPLHGSQTNFQRGVKWGTSQYPVCLCVPPPDISGVKTELLSPGFCHQAQLPQISPVTLSSCLRCWPGPRLCDQDTVAQWKLSTLNLNYLHAELTNCGRQEAVKLT